MKNLYLGTSGISLPYRNKSEYPVEFQEKSRLQFFSTLTNSVEINTSFYTIPMPKTVEKWTTEVPEDFKFTFKLWRGITHNKGFEYDPDDVKKYMATVEMAGEKKGSLLVQFPPSLKIDKMLRVRNLLEEIKDEADNSWDIAAEFRNATWHREDFYEMLNGLKVGLVIHDKHGNENNQFDQEVRFRYLRFHGPNGDYKGSYSDALLMEYAELISEWLSDGNTVYVYFNNTAGNAFGNLVTLRAMVEEIIGNY